MSDNRIEKEVVYIGARLGSKGLVYGWLVDGVEHFYKNTSAHSVGHIYLGTFSADSKDTSMYGKPEYTNAIYEDQSKSVEWASEDRVARVRNQARIDERKQGDALDAPLTELGQAYSKLRTSAQRAAFLAHVTERITHSR